MCQGHQLKLLSPAAMGWTAKPRHRRQVPLTLRVGLIGCGDWGRNHARALSRLGVLAAVGDQVPERAALVAREFVCTNLGPQAILSNPEIDVVVIAAAPHEQAALALRALQAGKHVLVEKPMAMTTDDAESLCDAALLAGRVAMTGLVMQFHPAFIALQRLVDEGALGRLRRIEARRTGFGKFFAGVDVLWDLAPHDLSMQMALIGRSPVTGSARYAVAHSDLPDAAVIALDYGEGLSASIQLSRVAGVKARSFTVIGTEGTAVFDDLAAPPHQLSLAQHGGPPRPVPFPAQAPLDAEINHFLACIRDGSAPVADLRFGRDVLKTLAAIPLTEVPVDDLPEGLVDARFLPRALSAAP